MLLRRIRIPLILEHRQRSNQFWSGLGRFDHFVDEATFGGDIRVRELVFQLSDLGAAGGNFV